MPLESRVQLRASLALQSATHRLIDLRLPMLVHNRTDRCRYANNPRLFLVASPNTRSVDMTQRKVLLPFLSSTCRWSPACSTASLIATSTSWHFS